MGVTVQSTFMVGCTFLEHIYGWVWVFFTVKARLWVGAPFHKIFLDGYGCLEDIYK